MGKVGIWLFHSVFRTYTQTDQSSKLYTLNLHNFYLWVWLNKIKEQKKSFKINYYDSYNFKKGYRSSFLRGKKEEKKKPQANKENKSKWSKN